MQHCTAASFYLVYIENYGSILCCLSKNIEDKNTSFKPVCVRQGDPESVYVNMTAIQADVLLSNKVNIPGSK